MQLPKDRNGNIVRVGTYVRLLSISGRCVENLPFEEKHDVLSMVGKVFKVEEIDEYGQPWVCKSWPEEANGSLHSHSIALEDHEMELVSEADI